VRATYDKPAMIKAIGGARVLFLKAVDRRDTGTTDMFGTHLETHTRKDGVVQSYHVSAAKKLSKDEANRELGDAWWGGKNKGQKRVDHDYTGNDDGSGYIETDFPLDKIKPNEAGDRYDGTADADRVKEYANKRIDAPVHLLHGDRAARLGIKHAAVMDGGHRVSAARLRGDSHIRAIMQQSHYDRLMGIAAKPTAEEIENKRQMLQDFIEARPGDQNAGKWHEQLAALGGKIEEKKAVRGAVDQSGWSLPKKSAYALKQEYEKSRVDFLSNKGAATAFKAKVRALAKRTPESDDGAVMMLDNIATKMDIGNLETGRGALQFASDAPIIFAPSRDNQGRDMGAVKRNFDRLADERASGEARSHAAFEKDVAETPLADWTAIDGVKVLRSGSSKYVAVPRNGKESAANFDIIDTDKKEHVTTLRKDEASSWLWRAAKAEKDAANAS
jgi:hypothetical protein